MITKEFLTAGKATFTIENTETAKHITFRVLRGRKTEKYPKPLLFVSVMRGNDNEQSYAYMGVLDENTLELKLTARSRFQELDVLVRAFRYAVARILANVPDTDKVKIHHEGRCGRCRRILTNPDSIESGIGPECGKHIHPGYHSTTVKSNKGQLALNACV